MFLIKLTTALFAMLPLALAPVFAAELVGESQEPLSFKECGAQYQAAKAAGTLGGRKWMDYRRDVCRIAAPNQAGQAASLRSEAVTAETMSRLVLPAAVASEFGGEKPSTARMRTCLKSYHEAKKAGALYGVRWVQKGGGYYSLCSRKLKATASNT